MLNLNLTTLAALLISFSAVLTSTAPAADRTSNFAEHEVWLLVDMGMLDEAEAWDIIDAHRSANPQAKPKPNLPSGRSPLSGTDLGSTR